MHNINFNDYDSYSRSITIPNTVFNCISVDFINVPKTKPNEYLALRFNNNIDINCYVPNMDYFHFSIYENVNNNRYVYNLGIGNREYYNIRNVNVRLYKFTVVYRNGICRLEFTPVYHRFNVNIKFTNYPITDMKELIFIKNKTPIYVNSHHISLRLVYTPDLHLQVRSDYGELSGYENLEIKNADRSLIHMIEFTFNSDMFLIANIKMTTNKISYKVFGNK